MKIFRTTSSRKYVTWLFVAVIALFIIFFVLVYLPLNSLFKKSSELRKLVKPAKDALLLQDLPKLSEKLQLINKSVADLAVDYGRLSYLSIIPFFGSYYSDGYHVIKASQDLISSTDVFIQTVVPYSAKLGFKGGDLKEPIVGGQERLAGLVKVAPAISENYEKISKGIHLARLEMEKVNTGKYPETLMGYKIKSVLEVFKEIPILLDSSSADIKNLLSELPALLGEPKKISYLILFQNDKELRPTGGFLTAYAIFTLERGRIISVTSGDLYFPDIDKSSYPVAPDVIQKYLKIKDWYIRDANISPDFKVSAGNVEKLWSRIPGLPKFDGIIAIDTHFLESLVGLLGDIEIPGYEKFTKDNIVYQLEYFSNVVGSKLEKRGGRKDLIGVLMQHIMQKAFSQSSKQYGQLISVVWSEAEQKHAILYLHAPGVQNLAEKYNFAGRISESEGDYLHINDANFAGRKANWYITEKVSKTVERQGSKIVSTLTIDYENTGDYNADFNTGYRDYVRVYVPQGSKLLGSDGSLGGTEQSDDLGKTVFASYMAVDPKKKARLILKYELPEGLIKGSNYRLLVQKQPGTDRFEYEIKVGNKVSKFELLTDNEVDLKF